MKSVLLVRGFYREDGTFGMLGVDSVPICVSVERPWANNQKGISCIPVGVYQCKRVNSPKFGNTFEVTGVSGRSEILFHSGNVDDDSHGCIILGENFEPWTDGSVSVRSSKQAFSEFLQALVGEESFELTITGVVK